MQLKKKSSSRCILYAVLLILALTAMMLLHNMSSAPVLEDKKVPSGGDTLDIAIEYSPLSLYMIGDTLGGFNYEFSRRIASENGLNVKYHPISNFNQALESLNSGLYDVIIADIALTAGVQDDFLLTEPTFIGRQVLVQKKSADSIFIHNTLELAGREVYVSRNSPALLRLRNLREEIGDTIMIIESPYGSEQLFLKVSSGEIECAVINEHIASAMSQSHPDVDFSTSISFNQFQSWLLRRSDEKLKLELDSMILKFKDTDDYRVLLDRY